jgi:hypothetical protein
MVSLWGKKDDDEQADEVVSNNGGSSTHRDAHPRPSSADERTRLLPPPSREGYLSPDDPAVSSARAMLRTSSNPVYRSLRTTCGRYGLRATLPFSSLSSIFSGGPYS